MSTDFTFALLFAPAAAAAAAHARGQSWRPVWYRAKAHSKDRLRGGLSV